MRIATISQGDPDGAVRAAGLGFDALLTTHAGSLYATTAPAQVSSVAVRLLSDVAIDAFPLDHPLVAASPQHFVVRRERGDGPIDPRRPAPPAGEAFARLRQDEVVEALLPIVTARLAALADAGWGGFRFLRPDCASADSWARITGALRRTFPDIVLIAQTPGMPREEALALASFDHLVSSFAWWDLAAPWLVEEVEALRLTAPLLADLGAVRADQPDFAQRLIAATASHAGFILPLETAASASRVVTEAAGIANATRRFEGELRHLTSAGGVTALLRSDAPDHRDATEAMLVLLNRSAQPATAAQGPILAGAGIDLQPFRRLRGQLEAFAPLAPREARLLAARRARPVAVRKHSGARAAREAAQRPRLVIADISPDVDNGAFPAKATVGDRVIVEANVIGDGHELIAAELRWRAIDESEWRSVRMEALPNDLFRAPMGLDRLGRHEFQIEGWIDVFGGFRRDFRKKLDAGVAQGVDYQEGRRFVERAIKQSEPGLAARLKAFIKRLEQAKTAQDASAVLLDDDLAAAMDEAGPRAFLVTSGTRQIDAERLAARFSSWYELFPRSQTDDPSRHGNFDDVIRQLPRIRAMGFDTLYFTPIHPIGRAFRKGPNNTLNAGPDDPGSPYAIGSDEGGHDAIHPELGTIEDFRRMVAEAHRHGLEIALDFAIQCSPDHPWLQEHPGWFDYRPDGTIKYAENPPKKYQDIVNVDFYKSEAVPDLWLALRDAILFWAREGVRVFRVDNPHTKPLPFWEWMIADVRAVHPDIIFLSEAFTRPNMMYRLAKIGFSQSYTYFTWRDTKAELTEYLTELNTAPVRDFYRPHFFVNTPDINPIFLHNSGPPGFRIRAALAATLSGLFGVYSGFELCEAAPVPGKEEYWDSEKYVVKPRDWTAEPNVIPDITRLNRLRRAYPALQTHLGLSFYHADNDKVLYYGKRVPGSDEMILVAISLDPHNAQGSGFELPLWEFGLQDWDSLNVEDLVQGGTRVWTGKKQYVRLTPDTPYAIWRATPLEEAA